MSKKVKIPLIIVLVLLFLTSMAAVAYPYISNYLAEQRQAEIVLKYDEVIEAAGSTENSKALEAARAYNAALANGQTDDIADYNALLDLTGNGMMGIIKILRLVLSCRSIMGRNLWSWVRCICKAHPFLLAAQVPIA